MDQADLHAAVMSVDVLDTCGKIIANPERAMVSHAAKIAMAHCIERLWEIALEAETLARAIVRPAPATCMQDLGDRGEQRQELAERTLELIAAIRVEETTKQETENGSDIR